MLNLIQMELYKLRHNKSFYTILFIVGVFSSLFSVFLLDSKPQEIFAKDVLSITFKDLPLSTLLSATFAGLFIGSEFTNKTITHEIISGHSRFSVIISKTMSFFIGTIAIILIYPLVCIFILMIVRGWGEPFTYNSFLTALRITTLGLIVNLSNMSICVLLAFILRDVGKTMGVSYLLLMFTQPIFRLFSKKSDLINNLYAYTSYNQIDVVTKNILSTSDIVVSIITSFGAIILFLSVTYIFFRKADLK